MNSMKMYLAFWLSGLIAGVVLVERWRRRGGDLRPSGTEWPERA